MKLKSLKITSCLLLVLSFNSNYSHSQEERSLNAAGCNNRGTYSKYTTSQRESCDSFKKEFNRANSDEERQALSQEFDDTSETARRKAAEAGAKRVDNNFCNSYKEKSKPAKASAVMTYGSGSFSRCDELAWGNMKTIYESGSRRDPGWDEFLNFACASHCSDKPAFEKCISDKAVEARRCESVAYIYNSFGRKWSNPDQVQATEGSSSSGAVGAKTSSNGSSASVSVGGGSIKCVSKGIETVDYDACKEFQVKADLMDGIQAVGYAAQELVYKDKMVDAQAKYATEENTATGALKAQGESLKDQQGMFQQRTAVDATKLAYLYSIYNEFPKNKDVLAKCESINSAVRGEDAGAKGISKDDCAAAVTPGQGGFAITMNQAQIEAMRARLITYATSAGSNLLLANLLGKRADDVNNAIAKIDAYQPIDPFTTTESDAQTTFCKMNPGVASCLTGDLDRTFDTMNDNVITFGEGATGTSYGSNLNADGSVITNPLTDTTTRSAVGPVGSVIAAAAQDNSMEGSDAASVKSGGTGSSGGGGGGSGGGASGGGGGGGAPAGGAAAGQAAAIASRAPNYNGGGGSFSVMGGFGINKKKADGKTEDNPFGKLFGKDGANKGDVVNFRDLASQKVGGKSDNLFDMISKRYSSVNADKRLLEYELKK